MLLRTSILSSLIAISALSYAQQPVTPAMGILPAIAMQSGEYSFEQYNRGELHSKYIDILNQRHKADAEYVQRSVEAIEAALSDLIQIEIMGPTGLQMLADASVTGQVDLDTYLATVRRYEQAKLTVDNRIKTVTALPLVLDGAEGVKADGSGLVEIPQLGKVNFAPILEHYNAQLAALDAQVKALVFNLIAPNADTEGALPIPQVSGLRTAFPDAMSIDVIKELRNDMVLLRAADVDNDIVIDQYTLLVKREIESFVEAFGTSQEYRLQQNEEGRKKRIEELEDMFFSRSLMRLAYGYPIGALTIQNWEKVEFNLDWLVNSTHMDISSTPERNKDRLKLFQDKMISALAAINSRSQDSFGRDVKIMDRFASFVTLVKGEAQLAQVNELVLRLMIADIEEELILRGKGLRALRDNYRARYYTTDESRQHYNAMLDFFLGAEESEDDDGFGVSMNDDRVGVEDIKGAFNLASIALENYETAFNRAKEIEDAIEIYEANNSFRSGREKRGNALRNF